MNYFGGWTFGKIGGAYIPRVKHVVHVELYKSYLLQFKQTHDTFQERKYNIAFHKNFLYKIIISMPRNDADRCLINTKKKCKQMVKIVWNNRISQICPTKTI